MVNPLPKTNGGRWSGVGGGEWWKEEISYSCVCIADADTVL